MKSSFEKKVESHQKERKKRTEGFVIRHTRALEIT